MADATVTMYADVVERAITAGRKLPAGMVLALRDVNGMIGQRIIARAQERAPNQSGTLGRSGHSNPIRAGADVGVSLTFGGLASKYAEVQHEREDLTHTPAAFRGKYGDDIIIGFGRRGHKVPRREAMKLLKATPGPTWSSHDKSGKLLGHKGGHAHFLYGAGTSAWNPTAQRWAAMMLDEAAAVIAERHLGGLA